MKLILVIFTLLCFYASIPFPAHAQVDFPAIKDPTKFSGKMLGDVIGGFLNCAGHCDNYGIIDYVFTFSGLAAFVFIIWSGFQLLTSKGNPKQVEEAKNKLTAAIVGFLIIFASYWTIQIVETILGVSIFK